MSETKHTPGPWFPALDNLGSPKVIAGTVDVARLCWLGFTMRDWQVGGHKAEDKRQEIAANASLISAAPDLLKALKEITEWAGKDKRRLERQGRYPNPEAMNLSLDLAAKAILMAEGRS